MNYTRSFTRKVKATTTCVFKERLQRDETQQQDLYHITDNIVENNAEDIVPIRDEVKEVVSLETLPIEITEKVFLYCLKTSSIEFPNHVCWTYNYTIRSSSFQTLSTYVSCSSTSNIY